MVKIAFGHKARSGKDTAADFLVEKHGGEILKFASAIYDISRYAYERAGLPFQKCAPLLQYLGTEWGRSVDENIWVNACLKDIERSASENIFITDCRFQNEALALKQAGFYLVKIERSAELRGDIGRDPNHPSETGLDGFDQWDEIVTNNGSLEEFHNKIETLYQKIACTSTR